MEHHHHHHHSHDHCNGDIKDMKVAFWLNLGFTIIEFIGGFLTNSFAIITDAFHDLGDSVALGLGIWLENYSKKEPSVQYTYGYKRFSLLSACILSIILVTGSAIMIVKSIENLFHPQEVESSGMIGLAVLGILVNGLAFWRMFRGNRGSKANSKAMMLHFLEDVLGWVAVLIGGVVIYFTHWFWIDAVLSIGIAVFIIYNAFPNLVSVFRIFLQRTPQKINIQLLEKELKNIQEILGIHKFHLWTEDGESHVATLHVLISEVNLIHSDKIRKEIIEILRKKHIHNVTVQIESIFCEDK